MLPRLVIFPGIKEFNIYADIIHIEVFAWKGVDIMDIAGLSVLMRQDSLNQQVSLGLVKMTMDVSTENAQDLIKMMELSVNPDLGSKLDIKV